MSATATIELGDCYLPLIEGVHQTRGVTQMMTNERLAQFVKANAPVTGAYGCKDASAALAQLAPRLADGRAYVVQVVDRKDGTGKGVCILLIDADEANIGDEVHKSMITNKGDGPVLVGASFFERGAAGHWMRVA